MHTLSIRVYYEDTDHTGVVYHPNYLKFMERGRTEMLRGMGVELDVLQLTHGVTFAVSEANIRYAKSAGFNDDLVVESRIAQAKGARMHFIQRILRKSELMADADVHLACLGKHGGPVRIPAMILNMLGGEHKKGVTNER